MGEQAREEIASMLDRVVDEFTAGDYAEDWDLEGLFARIVRDIPGQLRARRRRSAENEPRGTDREARRGRAEAVRRARAGARRRADARARAVPAAADDRSALARAPLRHGLPARGHRPARARPGRPADRVQERGLRAVPGPDEHDLVRLRAHDLQRRDRDGSRRRARAGGSGPGRVQLRAGSAAAGFTYSSGSSTATALGALAGDDSSPSALGVAEAPAPREDGGAHVSQRRVDAIDQIGRNDPCWCGSGKKFKKCHGV